MKKPAHISADGLQCLVILEVAKIARYLSASQQFINKQKQKYNWQSTGERVQGGGDKYNIDEVRFYKSNEKNAETRRAIRKAIQKEQQHKERLIKLAELKELQAEELQAASELPLDEDDRNELWSFFANKSNKQRDKAVNRVKAVQAYNNYKAEGLEEREAAVRVKKEFGCGLASIRNWARKTKSVTRNDVAAVLVNQTRGNREKAEFTPEAWVSFKKDWLRRGSPSISSCYRRLLAAAKVNNWIIPIKRTLENWIKRELDPMVILYRREGMEAVEKCFPAMKRNKEIFQVMEAVNGDGKDLGVWADFGNGVIVKPIVWSWQDIRSSKILSYRIDVSENRELLRLATLDLITDWGIPKYFYLDNTRAAASKQISGGLPNRYRFKVRDDDPLGIIPMIGSELKYVLPASGRSKPIERIHGIGGYSDFSSLPVFIGRGTKGRPIPIDELEEVFRSFVNEINARPDRQGDAVKGKSFDQVFNELYPETIITKATEKQRKYCMCACEVVMISNADASITLKAGKASFGVNRYANQWMSCLIHSWKVSSTLKGKWRN